MSEYVRRVRAKIGTELLLMPGVSAVIRRDDHVLLARAVDSDEWSLIGGGMDPGEQPAEALAREISEELGVSARVGPILGAYGGPELTVTYPNGDRTSYVTMVYACELESDDFALEVEEIAETRWWPMADLADVPVQPWTRAILRDVFSDTP